MDSKSIRYLNTRILVEEVGGVSNFAEKINKGQSQTSQFAGTTPIKGIGNKVAREIEEAFGKPHGWLDVLHEEDSSLLSNNLNASSSVVDNKELEALIKSLLYIDSQGKLSTDLIKALKTIVNLVN
ncbi:hypothetical protein [Acinetobacter nosocomialis]|uniref:hypothetical protein n=1 Tax=Acinetobacter nosocomialis TaxID=106654 RepID=UPI0025A9A262|nr:hypothetical protein [Acinetobacter nosocomialis]MDM9639328.1 hypothetical protein [Acinetobacter nosocomialis]